VIVANKGGPLAWWWGQSITARVKRAFRGVWARGSLPSQSGGLLVYSNHVGFWDGFVMDQLCRSENWDGYCFMEEEHLRRYRFLTRVGAFSVRRGNGASARESLRYARDLLSAGRTVFIFPQGELRPQATEPGPLSRGVAVLARQSGVRCLPLGLRYAFFEAERPEVLVQVGEVHPPGPFERFEEGLSTVMREVSVARNLEGWRRIVRGQPGVAERWDAVRGLPPRAA
jgi:1-acyl-sn-glycerol-3-phosphate acyltransferase